MRKIYKTSLLLTICLFLTTAISSCASATNEVVIEKTPTKIAGISNYTYKIVQQLPHDATAFTQGLVVEDGELYESNGQNGQSDLRILDLNTGSVKNKVKLGDEYFAEGMTILNEKIYQITWVNHKGFIYDENTLEKLGEFSYEGEGWGLTNDGRFLIMSNGTNAISYINPENFRVQKVIYVYDKGVPLTNLNELEYVKGEIYANIWHSDKVVQIDPALGEITGWIDLTGLRSKESQQNGEAVLNGIAYDAVHDRLFVTGKLWPTLFEIKLERK